MKTSLIFGCLISRILCILSIVFNHPWNVSNLSLSPSRPFSIRMLFGFPHLHLMTAIFMRLGVCSFDVTRDHIVFGSLSNIYCPHVSIGAHSNSKNAENIYFFSAPTNHSTNIIRSELICDECTIQIRNTWDVWYEWKKLDGIFFVLLCVIPLVGICHSVGRFLLWQSATIARPPQPDEDIRPGYDWNWRRNI